ncbi:hypothetical protein ADIS_0300 [Lunatimonas lonarensis]|uniref:Sensor of ECF-type sigma factor n=2 Tax=Lunatimonas lonarensis TaxID=1232681 RepID=R7ZYK8_9BACT|nr:hypothetical protein ADIS_0300 [Lunatimonas lonarensis]
MAQRPERRPDREKLEAARVAFITNRLSISPDQAEKFWPLYNQYNDNRMDLMKKIHEINKSAEGNLSDTKARELIAERFKIQEELMALEKSFLGSITSVISPAQAFKLSEANRDFTRQLYQMQQRRGGRDN